MFVGIIGGMGPESTIRLMDKIIRYTPVTREQDHLRMIVDNNPGIPDRTDFLLGIGPSPVPMLIESAQLLENAGANFIAIACNTAHAFIREIHNVVNTPVLDMLALTADKLGGQFPPGSTFLLLTTSGSLLANLFQKYLNHFRLKVPDPEQQNLIMEIIYGKSGVKCAGSNRTNGMRLKKVIKDLIGPDLSGIIAGCTEISLILTDKIFDLLVIDPLDILAREIVRRAKTD
ncbi:MAG: amino acid racemase [Calditrichota bacterium]